MLKKVREFVAICPGCLTWETLWFRGNTMEPTSRFTQKRCKVYHDCKLTEKPCRLYPRDIDKLLVFPQPSIISPL